MALRPDRIDRQQVLDIALGPMPDAVRNDNITLAYSILSQQMADLLDDHVNGNWCTFGVWGSASAGSGIRTDGLPTRLAEGIRSMAAPASVRAALIRRLVRLRSEGARHPARLLAAGNRVVFYEMAVSYLDFFEIFGERRSGPDELVEFGRFAERVPVIPPELGTLWPEVDPLHLTGGFAAYLEARRARTAKARDEWMLLANLRLAVYEQQRLQTCLVLAVAEPRIRAYAAFGRRPPPSPRTDKAMARLATRSLFAVDLGGETVPVHRDLERPRGEAFLPPTLRTIENSELRDLLEGLDRMHLDVPATWEGEGTAVDDWTDIDQRMAFVAALFRSRQQYHRVWNPPFPDADVAAIASGRRPSRLRLAPTADSGSGATANPRWSAVALDRARRRADPKADRAVAAYWQHHGDAPLHASVLAPVGELAAEGRRHEAIANFASAPLDVPPWADAGRIAAGQAFYRRFCLPLNLGLLVGSLPEAYAAAAGVEVLDRASALATDPKRRIGQTAQFVLDICLEDPEAPGSLLADDSVAAHSIRGVRLMHAGVRHALEHRDPEWDPSHGRPINQEDLLGTMLSFVVPPLDLLDRMGLPHDPRDAEDFLHLWCVAGALLGIEPPLLTDPHDAERTMTVAQARELAALIRRRQHRPSLAGQRLTAALCESLNDHTPPGLRGYPPALIRLAIGDDLADALGVPPRGLSDFVIERSLRLGSRLRRDRWFRWLVPVVLERLGEVWYHVYAIGDYAANPPFRFNPPTAGRRAALAG